MYHPLRDQSVVLIGIPFIIQKWVLPCSPNMYHLLAPARLYGLFIVNWVTCPPNLFNVKPLAHMSGTNLNLEQRDQFVLY